MIFSGSHEVESPEWWANQLEKRLKDRNKGRGWSSGRLSNRAETRPGLELLDAWRRNEPPLPVGVSQDWADAWSNVLRITRTNSAELVVSSRSERIVPLGWRTGVDGDTNGDSVVNDLARRTDLRTAVGEAVEDMLALGDGYLLAGPETSGSSRAVVTRESPLSTITAEHASGRPRAGLRMVMDEWTGEREAWVYLPGAVKVARKAKPSSSYAWVDGEGGTVPNGAFVLARMRNKDGVGEFERHLADCARINDALFNRVVLTKLQSHRQRALEKAMPKDGEVEVVVEYDAKDFETGPDALWDLPPGVKVWESMAADLTPVRSIVDDDFRILAAATKTPIWVMLPGSQNQSATGSEKADSAFLSLVSDRQHRIDMTLARTLAIALNIEGQAARAQAEKIRTIWAPQERYSLQEKSDAASKLNGILPFDRLAMDVLQIGPEDLPELNAARSRDLFFQQPGQPPVSSSAR